MFRRYSYKARQEDKQPMLMEILPLGLEEMFLCEVQALGYSFDIAEKGEGQDE